MSTNISRAETILIEFDSSEQSALVAAVLKYALEAFGAECEIEERTDVMRKRFRELIMNAPNLKGMKFAVRRNSPALSALFAVSPEEATTARRSRK